jgi:hypothetical protein
MRSYTLIDPPISQTSSPAEKYGLPLPPLAEEGSKFGVRGKKMAGRNT